MHERQIERLFRTLLRLSRDQAQSLRNEEIIMTELADLSSRMAEIRSVIAQVQQAQATGQAGMVLKTDLEPIFVELGQIEDDLKALLPAPPAPPAPPADPGAEPAAGG